MSKARKTYTREIKLEAIRLAESGGRTISQVERELGLSQGARSQNSTTGLSGCAVSSISKY
jgi:transposase-like protein